MSLDVMRGISLMGILFMNALGVHYFTVFDAPFQVYKDPWSQFLYKLNLVFIQNSFYPIFAFLFGVGLAIMFTNMTKKGMKPGIVLYRRVFAMLVFGTLHGLFLYNGDILHTYATLGLIVILFLFIRRKIAFIVSTCFLLLNFVLFLSSFNEVAKKVVPFERDPNINHILTSGHILEIIQWNMREFVNVSTFLSVGGFFSGLITVFPFILLGTWAYRFDLFHKMRDHLKIVAIVAFVSLTVGIFIKTLSFDVLGSSLAPQVLFVGGTFMAVGYFCIVTLLCEIPRMAKALNPMQAVGKLGFTVYITQSIILFVIFYVFKLYGTLSIGEVYLVTLLVMIFQIIACNIYLKFYKMGPLEWLWRKITYLK
ncbi:DUF418 domain-containing protein [Staphylococcus chromogenes]|uniref:DUF418 domain-containing protein n=1 Tax=Staphylococcus chromogenes TaxID=46126 RepID=UPI0021D19B2A|nr:DUF418 domain-containing protein [Staphylococcus chromogenes]UXS67940.1 DUF418 domain-containing protein [Staphylococcus chromogenes]